MTNTASATRAGARSVNPDWLDRSRSYYSTLRGLVTLIVKARIIRMTTEGHEHLPSVGPGLIMCNHQSNLDPLLVPFGSLRPFSIPGKKELFEIPVFGWLLRGLGSFPIDRDSADPGSLRRTLKVLRRGGLILVFPESTRSVTGEIGEFRPTLARLATHERVPVIPTVIVGTHRVLGRGQTLPRLGQRVVLRFGEPVDLTDYYGRRLTETEVEAASKLIRSAIVALYEREAAKVPEHGPGT